LAHPVDIKLSTANQEIALTFPWRCKYTQTALRERRWSGWNQIKSLRLIYRSTSTYYSRSISPSSRSLFQSPFSYIIII